MKLLLDENLFRRMLPFLKKGSSSNQAIAQIRQSN